jgi:hypothetical protein
MPKKQHFPRGFYSELAIIHGVTPATVANALHGKTQTMKAVKIRYDADLLINKYKCVKSN